MKKFKTILLFIIPLFSAFIMTGCQNNQREKTDNKITSDVITLIYEQNPWQVVRQAISLNIPSNKRIEIEKELLLKHKISLQKIIARAEPYVHYVVDQLKQRNMPIELALLPLMESAYNPLAISSAKAAGLWQIVPITAQQYGITKNAVFDPSKDVISSTETALTLLQNLNQRFNGDWLLTLAAYNAGEGRVKRAIRWNEAKNLPTHYWALNLSPETMRYIPKMLALVDIIKNSDEYGFSLPEFNYENTLVKIDIGQKIKLETIAQWSDLTLDELKAFNAGYTKETLNGPYHLLIPNAHAEKVHNELINKNYNDATLSSLIDENNAEKLNSMYVITLTNIKYQHVTNNDIELFAKEHRRHSQIIYRVKLGDNLSNIAKNHQVKISEILKWNNIKNANSLRPGDKLTINIRNGSSS